MLKKIVLGIVIGAILAFASSVYADDVQRLVGKQVDGTFPFYLNDGRLLNDVIVIEGASYAPVRTLIEALGLNVEFKEDAVRITSALGNEVDRMNGAVPKVEPVNDKETIQNQIDSLDRQIKWQEHRLYLANEDLKYAKPEAIPIISKGIEEIEARIADLERQKAELNETP